MSADFRDRYRCPKCGHAACDVSEMRATGGIFSKIFDVQSRRFTTLTCKQCTYTEFYRTKTSMIGNVFDFFTQ